jgi:hypothetical protein
MAAKSLIYVEESGLRHLQHAQNELKKSGHSKALTKKLNARIRVAARPIETDLKKSARELKFVSTSRQGGSRANRGSRKLKSGKWKQARSLRAEIDFGIKTKVSKGANTAGVRILENNPKTEVNRIARAINSKGQVRHPLFGNKNYWYMTKTSNGKGWFDKAGAVHMKSVTDDVRRVVRDFTDELTRKL